MYRNQLVVPSFEKQANKKKEKSKKEDNQEENQQAENQVVQPQQQIPPEQPPQQVIQPQQMPVPTGNEQIIVPPQQMMPNQPIAQQPQMMQSQQSSNIQPHLIGGAGVGAALGGSLGAWFFKDPAHKHIAEQKAKIDAIDSTVSDLLSSKVEIDEAGKVINNNDSGWLKKWGYKRQYGNDAERQKTLEQLNQEHENLLFEREKALQAIEEVKAKPNTWGRVGRYAGIAASIIGGAGLGASVANKLFNRPTPQANLNNPNNMLVPYQQQPNMMGGGYPMSPDMMGYPKMASLKPRYKIASICQRNQ